MKKLTLLLFIFMSSLSTFAQLVKGNKAIGGGLTYIKVTQPGYSIGGEANDSQATFQALPSFGYFFSDRLIAGINVGYSSTKITQFAAETTSSSFLVGPQVRYYMQTSNENFYVYGQLNFLFDFGKTKNGLSPDVKTSGLDLALSPGLAYFLNQHWAVEMSFQGFGYSKTDPNKDVDNNEIKTVNIGLNSLLPSGIGFRFHF